MSKIYTRTGDQGKTSLFDGTKVSKDDIRVSTYGTIDELNSNIGVAITHVKVKAIIKELEIIQNDLLEVGSALAVPAPLPVDFLKDRPVDFEKLIDQMTSKMPVLSNFILPGGSRGGAFLHVCRSVCRRTERQVVTLSKKSEIDSTIIIYLNRLSDLLFTFARFENYKNKSREKIWRKR